MYYFFFSYSRSDNTEYLRTFYKDLDEAVREKVGGADISFFDQSGNEPGDFWEENLERALARARVFVAVATADYVKKPYCGKEWAAFQVRIAQYLDGEKLAHAPPVAIPLLWVPPREDVAPFPDAIKKRHFHVDNPGSIPNTKGVAYLTKLKGDFKKEYVDLLDGLAERIVDLAHEHKAIDAYADVPKLAELESPFLVPGATEVGADPPVPKNTGGPRHVHFVYGALAPHEAKQAGRKVLDAYGEKGGPEWQPFYPEERPVGAVGPQVAGSDEIGMIPHELPLSTDLDKQVRTYEEQRQLVVVLLDAWTVRLEKYRNALRRLDQQNYINCSVLIPANQSDAETLHPVLQLDKTVRETLYHRFKTAGDLFLRPDIRDLPTLRQQIADVLIRLRAEVINRTHPESADLPAGGTRPTVIGPGSSL
jgi:FxsC-like protein